MELSIIIAIVIVIWFFRKSLKATAEVVEEEVPVVLTSGLKTVGIAARQLESNAYVLALENELEVRRRTADVAEELQKMQNTVSAKNLYDSLN